MTLLSPPPETPPRRRAVWLALGTLGALAAVVVVGVRFLKRPAAAPPTKPAARRAASPAPSLTPPPPSPARAREPGPPALAKAAPAPLRVEADVGDASVFVDRRFVGKAPVDVRDLAPGSHRVNVSADGYDMHAEDVELGREPRTVSVRFREVRLEEALAVVHKHGLGSCRGVLRADPGGLAFAAEGGKDSFHGAFRDLARFEIDYLGKTLRVGLRGGKSYNFSVDGPSADPLLVFHQKVEKARKRL